MPPVTASMKVAVSLTVEIDPEAWSLEYDVPPEEVRADVKRYLAEHVHQHLVSLDVVPPPQDH